MDAHKFSVDLAQMAADTWNAHREPGLPVIIRMRPLKGQTHPRALVKSVAESAALVGPLPLEAAIWVRGIGWVGLSRVQRTRHA